MEEIYKILCDVIEKEKDYTKTGIENLLKNKNVVVEYENGKKTLCETLDILDYTNTANYIRITKGGIFQIIEMFTACEYTSVSKKNVIKKRYEYVRVKKHSIEV